MKRQTILAYQPLVNFSFYKMSEKLFRLNLREMTKNCSHATDYSSTIINTNMKDQLPETTVQNYPIQGGEGAVKAYFVRTISNKIKLNYNPKQSKN